MLLCLPSSRLHVVVDCLISHLSHSLKSREEQYLLSPYSPFHTRFSQTNPVFKWSSGCQSTCPDLRSPKYTPTVPAEYRRREPGPELPGRSAPLAPPRAAARGRRALCFPFWPGSGLEACRAHALGAVCGRSGERRSSFWRTCTEVGRARYGRGVLAEGVALSCYSGSTGDPRRAGVLLARA